MRANGYSAWVRCSRSTGPMLFPDRMNVLSVNSTMEPVLLYMEHIINCLLTSKTNEILLHLIFYFGCLLFIKIVKSRKWCLNNFYFSLFQETANQGNLMAFIVYFICIFNQNSLILILKFIFLKLFLLYKGFK